MLRIIGKILCLFGIHKWKIIDDTKSHRMGRCSRCGVYGHQDVMLWGYWEINHYDN